MYAVTRSGVEPFRSAVQFHMILGDDHGCVSSSMPHQSEHALIAWGMPVINL